VSRLLTLANIRFKAANPDEQYVQAQDVELQKSNSDFEFVPFRVLVR